MWFEKNKEYLYIDLPCHATSAVWAFAFLIRKIIKCLLVSRQLLGIFYLSLKTIQNQHKTKQWNRKNFYLGLVALMVTIFTDDSSTQARDCNK